MWVVSWDVYLVVRKVVGSVRLSAVSREILLVVTMVAKTVDSKDVNGVVELAERSEYLWAARKAI